MPILFNNSNSNSNSNNATVPGNAPIQPPQAFVDSMSRTIGIANPYFFDGSNIPITSINCGALFSWQREHSGSPDADFSGCALSEASVNAVLANFATNIYGGGDQILNLSGGTNAAPTGQGLTDKATLIAAGWTVTTN